MKMRTMSFVLGFAILFGFIPDMLTYNDEGALDIAAFNVQSFGRTKMKDKAVKEKLVEIVLRYDLILIQEIRDSSGDSILELMSAVNLASSKKYDSGTQYGLALSPRLGRTDSKEQYAFIYRKDWLRVVNQAVYNDVDDVFEREPYYVHFQSDRAMIKDFVTVGIHTKPDEKRTHTEREISKLADVYDSIVSSWRLSDVIIMGDFNGGCNYVEDWSHIKLASNKAFYWLIDDHVDTTVKQTECPYDRIVVRGDRLVRSVIPTSPSVYRYDFEMGLSQEFAEDISDHYPVAFQIYSKKEHENTRYHQYFTIQDSSLSVKKQQVYALRRDAIDLGYEVDVLFTKSGAYASVQASRAVKSIPTAITLVSEMRKMFPALITYEEMYAAQRHLHELSLSHHLAKGFGKYSTLYDYYKSEKPTVSVGLKCLLNSVLFAADAKCELFVSMVSH